MGRSTAMPPPAAAPGVRIPAAARDDWLRLASAPATHGPVGPDDLGPLPAPVRRWVRRCVPTGTPRTDRVQLEMVGEIRLGRWVPFRARQVLLGPAGMVWAARAAVGPVWMTGFDRVVDGRGEMRWKLLGAVPALRAVGTDVDRSAAGRLAGELLLNPTSAVAPWVSWRAVDDSSAVAVVDVPGGPHEVTLGVDDGGLVRSATLRRWGAPYGGAYGEHVFHVEQAGTTDADGVTIAGSFAAGWDWDGGPSGTGGGPFFRATVTRARLG